MPNDPAGLSTSKLPRRLYSRRIFWLILLILLGPWVVMQVPLEVGRWKLAAAVQARADGHKEEAYAKLAEAMRWIPNSPMLHLQRAEWRMADGEADEAFADNDKMLELSGETYEALKTHSEFLLAAGRHSEAVADWRKIDQISQRSGTPSRAEALNSLAYFQALGKLDLEDALKHANEALEFAPGSAGILDTRGYIQFLLGRYDAARTDMDRAIEFMEPVLAAAQKLKSPLKLPPKHPELANSRPHTGRDLPELESIKQTCAVLYYHRSQILAALGNTTKSDSDRAKARALIGREPDETLY